MATINITTRAGETRSIPAREGLSVMQLLRSGGIDEIVAMCGGGCSCATCHVYVEPGQQALLPPMGSDEQDLLETSDHFLPNSRLSCQIRFTAALDGLNLTVAPED
jgi:2Fe-2S ferredoxin